MKQITIPHLKTRYPRSYYELLEMLDVRAYNLKALKLAAVRSVQVFAGKKKRYYCYMIGMEACPFGSVYFNLTDGKYDDCYVLTIASSAMIEQSIPGATGSLVFERLQYEVYIKDRIAQFANNTDNTTPASSQMISLFIYNLRRLVDIDITSIRVFIEDTAFIDELQNNGFEITESQLDCITLTKNIGKKSEPVWLLS